MSEAVAPQHSYLIKDNQSILGRIIRITQEVIEYRKWIKDLYAQSTTSTTTTTTNTTTTTTTTTTTNPTTTTSNTAQSNKQNSNSNSLKTVESIYDDGAQLTNASPAYAALLQSSLFNNSKVAFSSDKRALINPLLNSMLPYQQQLQYDQIQQRLAQIPQAFIQGFPLATATQVAANFFPTALLPFVQNFNQNNNNNNSTQSQTLQQQSQIPQKFIQPFSNITNKQLNMNQLQQQQQQQMQYNPLFYNLPSNKNSNNNNNNNSDSCTSQSHQASNSSI